MATNDSTTSDVNMLYREERERAEIRERVANQSQRIGNIENEMRTGFTSINAALAALANEFRAGGKTQWPVIWSALGVSFAILTFIGLQALNPIKELGLRNDQNITRLVEVIAAQGQKNNEIYITRNELDQRAARTSEDRERISEDINSMREKLLPRAEWSERNASRDHEIASLQKQIDLQRSDFATFANSLGNGRDFIVDMKQEIERLRDRINHLQIQRSNP